MNQFFEKEFESGGLYNHKPLSASYVNSMIYIVNSTLSFANEQGFELQAKVKMTEFPTRSDAKWFSGEEQSKLEDYLIMNLDGYKLGIIVCLYTGLRLGEICGLKWEDFDFKKECFTVSRTVYRTKNLGGLGGKTKLEVGAPKSASSQRVIPIHSELLKLMKIKMRSSRSPWVISDNFDKIPDPRSYQNRYKKYLEQCSISYKSFHSLRHTFATRFIESGGDIKSLSEILGHSKVGITLKIYVHSSLAQKRSQIELLNFRTIL